MSKNVLSLINNKGLISIPVSINDTYFGKKLDLIIENGNIIHIGIKIRGEELNFLELIQEKAKYLRVGHKDKIVLFDSTFKFYLNRDSTEYVLAIKHLNDGTIQKIRYSLYGVVMSQVIDYWNGKHYVRKSDAKEMEFTKNYDIIYDSKLISLKAIAKPKAVGSFISDPNIGVIDTETFLDEDGTQKVYALGFKTNLVDKPVMYYIDKYEIDSTKIILAMINDLLRPKYNKMTFYCHNLARYDIVFILKTILVHNEGNSQKYDIKLTMRKDEIIQLIISRDGYRFVLRDSYSLLPDSL